MPTKFPGEIDTFVNPSAGSPLTNPPHAQQHTDENDAIVAIQEALGTNPQGSSATVNARLTKIEGDLIGPAGGDLTGDYPDPLLKNVLAQDSGTYGSSTEAVVLSVDRKGRILSIQTQPIAGGGGGADVNAPYIIWTEGGDFGPPYSGLPNARTLTGDGDVSPINYTKSDFGDDPITYEAVKLDLKYLWPGGTFGNSTSVPQITVDTKGRVVSVVEVPISGGGGGGGTADDISGGAAGNLLYQQATNDTAFVTNGTPGQVLRSAGSGMPTWIGPESLSVGSATNKPGGTAGQILYQANPGVTTFAGPGAPGQVLVVSNDTSVPTFVNPSSLHVGSAATATSASTATMAQSANSATNVLSVSAPGGGRVLYQVSTSVTGFTDVGNSGDILVSGGTGKPLWQATLPPSKGGTGVSNADTETITLGGLINTSGEFRTTGTGALTLNTTAATNVTLPTSGTLVPTTGAGASGTWGISVTGTAGAIAGGANKQLLIQTGGGTTGSTGFVSAPTAAGQVLTASGASLTVGWSAPTGVSGTGTSGDLAVWNGGQLTSFSLADITVLQAPKSWGFHEDFAGTASPTASGEPLLGTRFIGTITGSSSSIAQGQHSESISELGVMRLVIDNPANSLAVIHTKEGGINLYRASTSIFQVRIFIPELSNSSNTYILRVGYGRTVSSSSDFGNNALYFEYSSANSPNWRIVSKTQSLVDPTINSTTQAVNALVWTTLTIATSGTGTSANARFLVNGTLVGTLASTLPAGDLRIIPLQMYRTGGSGTADRFAYIDYCTVGFSGLDRT